MARKFIIAVNRKHITDGKIILGEVGFHRQLLGENDGCFGGGEYLIDEKNKTLILKGESVDFGEPRWEAEFTSLAISDEFKGWKITYEYPSHYWDEEERENVDVSKLITAYL